VGGIQVPVKVQKLPYEPVILVTFKGVITADDCVQLFEQCARLGESIRGHIYRVIDIRQAHGNVRALLEQVWQGRQGHSVDPRYVEALVGAAPIDQNETHAALFDDVEVALAYLREQIVLEYLA
jgi:hypothetical protein